MNFTLQRNGKSNKIFAAVLIGSVFDKKKKVYLNLFRYLSGGDAPFRRKKRRSWKIERSDGKTWLGYGPRLIGGKRVCLKTKDEMTDK
jgi:hypothetical protein